MRWRRQESSGRKRVRNGGLRISDMGGIERVEVGNDVFVESGWESDWRYGVWRGMMVDGEMVFVIMKS